MNGYFTGVAGILFVKKCGHFLRFCPKLCVMIGSSQSGATLTLLLHISALPSYGHIPSLRVIPTLCFSRPICCHLDFKRSVLAGQRMVNPFGFTNEHNAVLQIMGTPLLALPNYITHTIEYERTGSRKKEKQNFQTKTKPPGLGSFDL